MLPFLPSPLLTSSHPWLTHFSPACTSLPLSPPHLLIPRPNAAPQDVTCHFMLAKSLCHRHHIVVEKKTTIPPSPHSLWLKKKKENWSNIISYGTLLKSVLIYSNTKPILILEPSLHSHEEEAEQFYLAWGMICIQSSKELKVLLPVTIQSNPNLPAASRLF